MASDDYLKTPRSLRVSFEFDVERGLPVNIRDAAVQKAMDSITERVLGMAEAQFPWARTAVVRKQWIYPWTDDREVIELPKTDKNTKQA